jgi:glucosamine--fructose-6-phosphate aminotransferase (isomerizing)
VASTKAFTGQLTALMLIALYLGQVRGTPLHRSCQKTSAGTHAHPAQDGNRAAATKPASSKIWRANFSATPISCTSARHSLSHRARRRALKLKEISYIHAEGYPAGEMKHGPNALIDENLPVVVVATRDENDPASMTRYEKSVLQHQGSESARRHRHLRGHRRRSPSPRSLRSRHRNSPAPPPRFWPLLEIIPLQLLAYHIAVRRGCDVDQPAQPCQIRDRRVKIIFLR